MGPHFLGCLLVNKFVPASSGTIAFIFEKYNGLIERVYNKVKSSAISTSLDVLSLRERCSLKESTYSNRLDDTVSVWPVQAYVWPVQAYVWQVQSLCLAGTPNTDVAPSVGSLPVEQWKVLFTY